MHDVSNMYISDMFLISLSAHISIIFPPSCVVWILLPTFSSSVIKYSLLMRNESRSNGSGSTKSKGGVTKSACESLQSDGRSKAQKKADVKYYEV